MVAHLSGNNTCYHDYKYMYYECRNGSWVINLRGGIYAAIDQIYCYESDESSYEISIYCIVD